MLLSVYAMLRQDQNDEWRDVQRTAFEIDSQIRDRELRKVENADFVANRDQIAKQIEVASALGDFRALHPVSARTGAVLSMAKRWVTTPRKGAFTTW